MTPINKLDNIIKNGKIFKCYNSDGKIVPSYFDTKMIPCHVNYKKFSINKSPLKDNDKLYLYNSNLISIEKLKQSFPNIEIVNKIQEATKLIIDLKHFKSLTTPTSLSNPNCITGRLFDFNEIESNLEPSLKIDKDNYFFNNNDKYFFIEDNILKGYLYRDIFKSVSLSEFKLYVFLKTNIHKEFLTNDIVINECNKSCLEINSLEQVENLVLVLNSKEKESKKLGYELISNINPTIESKLYLILIIRKVRYITKSYYPIINFINKCSIVKNFDIQNYLHMSNNLFYEVILNK